MLWPANKKGYLLIEVIIALGAVAICATILASLYTKSVILHTHAKQYLQATTLAQCALRNPTTPSSQQFTITHNTTTIDTEVPFTLQSATVSWQTAQGNKKNITLHAGMENHAPS